jgi:hypothetical protein
LRDEVVRTACTPEATYRTGRQACGVSVSGSSRFRGRFLRLKDAPHRYRSQGRSGPFEGTDPAKVPVTLDSLTKSDWLEPIRFIAQEFNDRRNEPKLRFRVPLFPIGDRASVHSNNHCYVLLEKSEVKPFLPDVVSQSNERNRICPVWWPFGR